MRYGAFYAVLILGLLTGTGGNTAPALLQHAASYDVFVRNTSDRIGQFTYRFTNECNKFIVYHHWKLELPNAGNLELNTSLTEDERSISHPFKLLSLAIKNGEPFMRKSFDVKTEDSKEIVIANDGEKIVKFPLPKDILYPMEYQQQLIKAAFKNKKTFNAYSFDDGQMKIAKINSIILGEGNPSQLKSEFLKKRPMRISQTAVDDNQTDNEIPNSIIFDIYENGIMDNITIKIGAFQFVAKMNSIEKINKKKCL